MSFEVSFGSARVSTAQARAEFRLRRQCRTDWLFYRAPVHVLKQNMVLRDTRSRSDGFGRRFVKIVAVEVFCGRCQNVGRRVSFEGLRFSWQPQEFAPMDPMFSGRIRAPFLRKVAFLELQFDDAFAWPVQHFV